MGQYAVILTISAILLGGVLLFNARASTDEANTELSAYQTDRIAREASQVALREAVRELNARPDDWTDVLATAQARFNVPLTDHEKGSYSVTVTEMYLGTPTNPADPDRVRLSVEGTYENWNETTQSVEPTDFTLDAVYERGWTDVNVPGGFRDAIWSDDVIDIRGNVQVSGDVHSNGSLTSSGGSFDVYGTGTYTGSESANDSRFTGGVAERDSILIPPVAIPPATYHSSYAGNFTLSESNDPTATAPTGDSLVTGWSAPGGTTVTGKGTENDPFILYVNGDLDISGNVDLVGHIRIYVDGAVDIGGNSSLASVTATTPNPNQDVLSVKPWVDTHLPGGVTIGIYATGDVTLRGTMFVAATIHTRGAIKYAGGGHKMMVGGLITYEPMDIRGNAKVYYKEGADSVYDPGIPRQVPEGIRLVAYREWADRP